jgi:hypothetical protein
MAWRKRESIDFSPVSLVSESSIGAPALSAIASTIRQQVSDKTAKLVGRY